MLVLSRGQNEKIVFPRLSISVEVLQIGRNKVRIGVKAPRDIAVLRDELEPTDAADGSAEGTGLRRELSHELRNRLHTAQLALRLSQRLLSIDRQEEAEETLQRALNEFAAVEQRLNDEFPARSRRRRALVVDDNENESELLAAYLRACGYQVETARDGCDAMQKLEASEHPDVLLLDMAMPRCDGPSMLRDLGGDKRFDGLTVFAVTGSEPDRYMANRACNRVDQWFQKPVDAEALVREMNRVLAPATACVN
ncbi:MAG: response regulator [Pirellulaceae bacterium]|nr:response regulator [Pirellulaceae bacterium]